MTDRQASLQADPRCQHSHDPDNPGRKCDSRCSEASAEPWWRIDGAVSHAWCLPVHNRREGWLPGPEVTFGVLDDLNGVDCHYCNCPMTEFPG